MRKAPLFPALLPIPTCYIQFQFLSPLPWHRLTMNINDDNLIPSKSTSRPKWKRKHPRSLPGPTYNSDEASKAYLNKLKVGGTHCTSFLIFLVKFWIQGLWGEVLNVEVQPIRRKPGSTNQESVCVYLWGAKCNQSGGCSVVPSFFQILNLRSVEWEIRNQIFINKEALWHEILNVEVQPIRRYPCSTNQESVCFE